MTPEMTAWKDIGLGCIESEYRQGETVRQAKVIQGGNNLWTAYVVQSQLGRVRKNGSGRIAGKTVHFEVLKPQAKTRQEAKEWAEAAWTRCPEFAVP